MVSKKAQTKHMKMPFIIVLLVFCVVFVMGAAVFTSILPTSDITGISSIGIEWNITSSGINDIKYNWNGTNNTIYNESTKLIFNFNNFSSLAENDTLVFDESGNGNNGTISGAIFNLTGGKYDGSFYFDGDNDYVRVENSPSLKITDEITISLWFKKVGDGDANPRLIHKRSWLQGGYAIYLSGANSIRFLMNNETNSEFTVDVANCYTEDIWTHLSFVKNNTHLSAYCDGNLSGTKAWTSGTINNTAYLTIGGKEMTVDNFNGTIDYLTILNRSSNQEEVVNNYLSNLKEYDSDKWNFYINQTGLISNVTGIPYNYYLCATNSSDYENCTAIQTITAITPNSIITANFSNSVGIVRSDFYGVNTHGIWGSNLSWIDANATAGKETLSDYEWHINNYIDTNLEYHIADMGLSFVSTSEGVFDNTSLNGNYENINTRINYVQMAKDNGFKIQFTASYMPLWLANTTEGWCTSDTSTCPPSNYTKWGELVVEFLDAVGCDAATCEVNVWNEPDWTGFWMSDVGWLGDPVRSVEYNKLYNSTYLAVKAAYPTMDVGGTAQAKIGTYAATPLYKWLDAFPNEIDFVNFHDYLGLDDQVSDDFYGALSSAYASLYRNMSFYGVDARVVLGEFNVANSTVRTDLPEEWSNQLAQAYMVTLVEYPENVSMFAYQWAGESNRTTGENAFQMVGEPLLDNTYFASYNVTKNFATYHSAGSTVYTSTTTSSAVKTISSQNGDFYAVTAINTDTEARNITINTTQLLMNKDNGDLIDSTNGAAGVADSYEIQYWSTPSLSLRSSNNLTKTAISGETYTSNEIYFSVDTVTEKHIASTLGENVALNVTISVTDCRFVEEITYTPDSGSNKQTFELGDFTCTSDSITLELNVVEPSLNSNILEISYINSCNNTDRTLYRLILIAGALLILSGVLFYMFRSGILSGMSMEELLLMFVIIIVGVVFFVASANIIGATCVV